MSTVKAGDTYTSFHYVRNDDVALGAPGAATLQVGLVGTVVKVFDLTPPAFGMPMVRVLFDDGSLRVFSFCPDAQSDPQRYIDADQKASSGFKADGSGSCLHTANQRCTIKCWPASSKKLLKYWK